jgi:hypothetical protein
LSGCVLGSPPSVPPSEIPPSELPPSFEAAAIGLCHAIGGLPDAAAVERAFTNDAHDVLHALAADPRLDRSAAALILEAMVTVETDFGASADQTVLADDLASLFAAADAALTTLGVDLPRCAP